MKSVGPSSRALLNIMLSVLLGQTEEDTLYCKGLPEPTAPMLAVVNTVSYVKHLHCNTSHDCWSRYLSPKF